MTTEEMIITLAYNGIMVRGEKYVEVIEDTHPGEKQNANLIRELGEIFHGLILNAMNSELANKVKVKIEITKED